MTHTPGPWTLSRNGNYVMGNGEFLFQEHADDMEMLWHNTDDLALILAAPDLLRVAKEMMVFMDIVVHDPWDRADWQAVIDRAERLTSASP